MDDAEFEFSTYEVSNEDGNMRTASTITRHMASDGKLSACGDTREDAERMLLIVRRRTYYRHIFGPMYTLKDEYK